MLKKVLDFEFNIKGMPIDRSGQGNHGHATQTVFTVDPDGTRGAGFLSNASRIDVPYNHSWNTITATRIDVRVRLNSLERRANLVEIERSVALFVRQDGVVTFTFYAPADDPSTLPVEGLGVIARPSPTGSSDPFDTLTVTPAADPPAVKFAWQGVNTDTQFSPNGQRHTVPLKQYVTITAIHDGLASMRVFINGALAGARYDIDYPVLPLVPPGIVAIGAWPHDARYTLRGSLDFVQIWRYDPHFPYRQFFCRPMSDRAKGCWHRILRHINDNFAEERRADVLSELVLCVDKQYRALYRAAAQTGETGLQTLQAFFRQYMQLWCRGDIDGDDMDDHQRRFLMWVRSLPDDAYAKHLDGMQECFAGARSLGLDRIKLDLRKCDPQWGRFVDLIRSVQSELP
jgi:hypothetical protein